MQLWWMRITELSAHLAAHINTCANDTDLATINCLNKHTAFSTELSISHSHAFRPIFVQIFFFPVDQPLAEILSTVPVKCSSKLWYLETMMT